MFPGYEDVTSRIDEEPTWYTGEGYPRYGYFDPGECNIYADYSTLMLILCQSCHKPMLIGQDWTNLDLIEIKIDVDKLDLEPKYHDLTDGLWIPLKSASFAPRCKDEAGDAIYRTPTLEDIVKNWGFGDPPNHGCVGDTMGSWEYRSVQAWDLRYGKIVKPSVIHAGHNIITNMGTPARIVDFENHQIVPSWTEQITVKVSEEEIQAVIARATNPKDPLVTIKVYPREELID